MKHIYIVYVDSHIGAFKPDDGFKDYALREKFVDFVLKIKEKFPEYKMKCVLNEGIEEEIRKKIVADMNKEYQRQRERI